MELDVLYLNFITLNPQLPKAKVQQWKEKLSRGEKIAAKLEFKKDKVV